MNTCDHILVLLDDAVDGELSGEQLADVERHLAGCAACSSQLEALKALKQTALALPAEMDPPRDLWPEIDRRIVSVGPRAAVRRYRLLAAAAVLVAVVGVSWMATHDRQLPGLSNPGQTSAGVEQAASEESSINSFRTDYQLARAELLHVIDQKRSTLAPETLQVIERNLVVIDQAIAEIELALAANPEAAPLDRQLRLAYRQQIEVLRWAAHLAA